MTGFQRLCLATTALVFVLIVVGGTVRATDSGLGCPDWPRCHGSLIPSGDKHTLIEYSHRLTASVVGLMVLATVIWAWRSYRQVRSIFLPSLTLGVLVLFQAGLGGLTVKRELPPGVVTVHLATAMILFATAIAITIAAFAREAAPSRLRSSPSLPGIALASAALAMAVMLLGAYISTAHYSLACGGWPLCNGDAVPNMNSESVRLVFAHRLLALILGGSVALLAARAWGDRFRSPLVANLALLAAAVYLAQALVGAANIWTRIDDIAQVAHLAVGSLLWGILALLSIRLFGLPELIERRRPAKAARPGLAGALR
jgi:heme A synthase